MTRPLKIISIIVLLFGQTTAQIRLVDASVEAGVLDRADEAVAWFDLNNDGLLDLFTTSYFDETIFGGTRLLLNTSERFVDITAPSSLVSPVGDGMAIGDYDNDGFTDVYITRIDQENILFRNLGDGTFADVTISAGVSMPTSDITFRSSASFVDYDNDGDLDLFAADVLGPDHLFRNNGNGTFTNQAVAAGVATTRATPHHTFTDYNNDGWMDLYVPSNFALADIVAPQTQFVRGDALYRNNADGTFTNVTSEAGINHTLSVEGVQFLDYNNDGWEDIFLSTIRFEDKNLLYRNDGNGRFTEVSGSLGLEGIRQQSVGITAGDYDNDGWMDLFVANFSTASGSLLRNIEGQRFEEVGEAAGISAGQMTVLANWGDYNGDGFLDLYVSNRMPTKDVLYRGLPNGNHWIHVHLVGRESNRNGIGARIKLTAGSLTMYRQLHNGNGYGGEAFPVEFGLGSASVVDEIEIRWPSGQVDLLREVTGDRNIRIIEGSGTHHTIHVSTFEHTLPPFDQLGNPFEATATVFPALFEPGATVSAVILRGLGTDVPLDRQNDGSFSLQASGLKMTGTTGTRLLSFEIQQMTSIGLHRTALLATTAAANTLPSRIGVDSEDIDLGEIEVGRESEHTIEIQSDGGGPLEVSDVRSNLDFVTISPTTFTLRSGSTQTVSIRSFPISDGVFSDLIEIVSNDPDAGVISIALSGEAIVVPGDPRADFDESGSVDFTDFLSFAKAFQTSDPIYDIDASGGVDFADFLIFAASFGKTVG